MKRAFLIVTLLFFFPLAFLPGDVPGATSPCSSSLMPPFIATGVKPNVLIILDNSNSMDEDFYGNAVGSYSPVSKSVVARQSLQNLVQNLVIKANVGIMTFTLPGDTSPGWYIHNAMPFTSYDPASYCANPPPDCVTYCATGSSTAKSDCEAACPGLTTTQYKVCCNSSGSLFTSGFPDFLLSLPPNGPYAFNEPTGTRARYCGLAYPKTTTMAILDQNGKYVNMYWNVPDPFYDTGNDGTQFGYTGSDQPYSNAYSPAENAWNEYAYYYNKLNYNQYSQEVMSDLGNNSNNGQGYSSYDTSYYFIPTDSDWALGFFNWGQRMPWYYVGPTWFSQSAPGSPQGYLHVAVGDLTNSTQYNNVYNILNPNVETRVPIPLNTPYMSCTQTGSNANTCPYIVNAGNTPTAGALTTALSYFNGTLSQNGTSYASPITSSCQQNYIILVTDGLPDTLLNGSQTIDTSTVMPQVITALQELANTPPSPLPQGWTNVTQKINGTTYTFPVLTYVLGIGSEATAGPNLNSMAVAGGTAVNGQAYYASDADALVAALNAIAANLLQRVAAGSSISILSEGQTQNGDNMLQAVFYPSKYFGTTLTYWPGYLYDYWFYNSTTYNNIREDTVHDYILELNEDDGISFQFNQQTGLSVNRYSDPTGSGNPSVFVNNEGLDSLIPLWEAGKLLYQTPASSRVIYTPGSSSSDLVLFNTSNATLTSTTSSPLGSPSNFTSCLQGSSGTATMNNLINYVMGVDLPGCRSRTVGLCSNGTSLSNAPCVTNSDCTGSGYGSCSQNVWKLGDIVYSTPQIKSDYKYCSNGSSFNTQACSQDADCTSQAYNSCQKAFSVVFVGANDGMLHAFQTGVLTTQGLDPSQHQIEALTGIPTSSMGTELWAFIPQNVLPYLRCLAVPPPGTCHLYYNDLSPFISTMNVDTTTYVNGNPITTTVTKTILIGGMRLGGGSVQASSPANYCFSSSGVSNGQSCTNNTNCTTAPYNARCSAAYPTNVPADTCSGGYVTCSNPATCYGNAPQNASSCIGLSSYYALDITDVQNPVLLWEFSHPFMGYTYSGPAVIHKWSNPSSFTGDQYYVMFLSGPTGPSDGSSVQDVKVFVLSLNSSLGIGNVYYNDLGSATKNGFGGRLFTSGLDVNGDGYTDFVFFGYANSPAGSATGWQGGIGKVNTNNSDASAALIPQNWTYDISTYSNIAQLPITAQIAAEQCFGTWYLYAGTGRYFFPLDSYYGPANSGLNYLMGIPFTCDQYNNNCTSVTSLDNSAAACTALQQGSTFFDQAGWKYSLNGSSGSFLNERMITDPTTSSTNMVFMVTSEPTSDPCSYGGQSRVWGLNCATGGAVTDTSCKGFSVTNLSGTMYLQTSTGAVYQISAASSFTDSTTGNRTTPWYIGMPPETAAPVVQPATLPTRTGQLIQWIER